jgi:enterochelin esterase-like enzyme
VPTTVPTGRVTRLAATDTTGRITPVIVWRPDVPDSAELPIVYFLHGTPGNADLTARTGVIDVTAAAVAAGLPPLVLVIPDGTGTRPDTEWGDATDGRDRVASRLVDVVLPLVEGTHRRAAAERALAGFSMGGFGAANLGLQHPDLFAQWASIGGYFHLEDPDRVFADPQSQAANSPDRHASRAAGQRVLLLESSTEEKGARGEAPRMGDLLRAAGIDVTVRIADGGHSWAFVLHEWPGLLRWALRA